ncbi:sigma-E factor regulatory protein RseB domain-containing protein [Brevibacillus thermoruber]|uniref:sigma-E factor regulatory protein RseB domain-containing protein n=1 Tax=Brevibacillus thermoruber TaxID=33942 RepID=UPI00048BB94A|nr:sigma-E factor regulatory protein RseB domain-containing protein [Brevibacillus thermoruber]
MSKKIMIAGCTGICLLLTSVAYGSSGDTGNAPSPASNETTVQQKSEIHSARQDITAAEIRDKMLNAIDYYTTIQGAYRIIQKPIGVDEVVEFDVSIGDTPGSYVKVKSNVTGKQSEHISNGETMIHLYEQEKAFVKQQKIKKVTKESKIQKGPRYYKDEEGIPVYKYRKDPSYAERAHDVIFPQAYGFWLYRYPHEIVGTEQYLDRTAVVLEGTLSGTLAEKHRANTFKLWVDQETGVLLKLVETDDEGTVMNQMEVLRLSIDKGADTSKFQIIEPKGWKDISPVLNKEREVRVGPSGKEAE